MSKPIYTPELTEQLVKDYQAGLSVKELAEKYQIEKQRSVVSKLVSEGVYKAPEKVAKTPKDEGPTKVELLTELTSLIGKSIKGIDLATKSAIQVVIDVIKSVKA